MNKTTVVSFRLKRIASVFKEGYSLIIMVVVYIAGIISGAFFTHGSDTLFSKAENIYNRFIAHRSEKSFLAIFGYSILEWIPYMLGLFVCGTCVVGIVIMPLLVFHKGLYYGLLAGYIYSCYSYSGIVFVLILIIPATLIGAFGMFFAARRSFSFSLILAKSFMPHTREYDLYNVLVHYCKEFLVLLIVGVFAALADGALCTAFFQKIHL